jgi:hypothetical protein
LVGELKRAIQIQDIESIYLSMKDHITSTRRDIVIHYAPIFKGTKKSSKGIDKLKNIF